MTLKTVLYDREAMLAHHNLTEDLEALFSKLRKAGVAVVDIGSLELYPDVSVPEEEKPCGQKAGKSFFELPGSNQKFYFCDCLVIADCEATVAWARAVNAAVLGYEPPAQSESQPPAPGDELPAQPEAQPPAPDDEPPAPASALLLPALDTSLVNRRRIRSHLEYLAEGFEEVDLSFLEQVYCRHHQLPWTVIETARCYLREITLEDLDAVYELYRPVEITRYAEGPSPDRRKQEAYTKAYIDNMYRFYGYGLWVVVEKESGRLIGRAGLMHLPPEAAPQEDTAFREDTAPPQGTAFQEDAAPLQLGYVIGLPYQNQGYATEVCRGILDYARDKLDISKIYCLIRKENRISIHLAEKLGFRWDESVVYRGKVMQRYAKILQFR